MAYTWAMMRRSAGRAANRAAASRAAAYRLSPLSPQVRRSGSEPTADGEQQKAEGAEERASRPADLIRAELIRSRHKPTKRTRSDMFPDGVPRTQPGSDDIPDGLPQGLPAAPHSPPGQWWPSTETRDVGKLDPIDFPAMPPVEPGTKEYMQTYHSWGVSPNAPWVQDGFEPADSHIPQDAIDHESVRMRAIRLAQGSSATFAVASGEWKSGDPALPIDAATDPLAAIEDGGLGRKHQSGELEDKTAGLPPEERWLASQTPVKELHLGTGTAWNELLAIQTGRATRFDHTHGTDAPKLPGQIFSNSTIQGMMEGKHHKHLADPEDYKKHDGWIYPEVHRGDAPTHTQTGEPLIPSEHGIFDNWEDQRNYSMSNITQALYGEDYHIMVDQQRPDGIHGGDNYRGVKERLPEQLRKKAPGPEESTAVVMEGGKQVMVEGESRTWQLWHVRDRETYETALGEQVFRTTDMDRFSCDYHPVGYGLPPHTIALVVEKEDTGLFFHNLCGGRSDHTAVVEGSGCYTFSCDIKPFYHVMNWFGEVWQPKEMARHHHKYRGLCIWGKGIDLEDAEFMDGFFDHSGLNIAVDIDRLDEGCEGHIPVVYCPRNGLPARESTSDDLAEGEWGPGSTGMLLFQNHYWTVPTECDTRPWYLRQFYSRTCGRPVKHNKITSRALHNDIEPGPGQDLTDYLHVFGLRGTRSKSLRAIVEGGEHAMTQLPTQGRTSASQWTPDDTPLVKDHMWVFYRHPMFTMHQNGRPDHAMSGPGKH